MSDRILDRSLSVPNRDTLESLAAFTAFEHWLIGYM